MYRGGYRRRAQPEYNTAADAIVNRHQATARDLGPLIRGPANFAKRTLSQKQLTHTTREWLANSIEDCRYAFLPR